MAKIDENSSFIGQKRSFIPFLSNYLKFSNETYRIDLIWGGTNSSDNNFIVDIVKYADLA